MLDSFYRVCGGAIYIYMLGSRHKCAQLRLPSHLHHIPITFPISHFPTTYVATVTYEQFLNNSTHSTLHLKKNLKKEKKRKKIDRKYPRIRVLLLFFLIYLSYHFFTPICLVPASCLSTCINSLAPCSLSPSLLLPLLLLLLLARFCVVTTNAAILSCSPSPSLLLLCLLCLLVSFSNHQRGGSGGGGGRRI